MYKNEGASSAIAGDVSILKLWLLLFSRLFLFAAFQFVIALATYSWPMSERYWMLAATFTNIVSISLLVYLFRIEGKSYFDIFRFDKRMWKKDLLVFSGLAVLCILLAIIPNYFLSQWFWEDATTPYNLLFQPIPVYISRFLLLAFPTTIIFSELATYFGYIMARLETKTNKKWLSILLPVLFLSIQHCTLPLVFDYKFIVYRAIVYLPFALVIGVVLNKRPRMLPYFAILHGLMDMQAVVLLWGIGG